MEGDGSQTDNAIGSGSIPKMAVLAGPDISRPVEPVFGRTTPTGTRTKSWRRPSCTAVFPSLAGLLILCALVSRDSTTAEAAGIGVHLRGHAQNIPRAVAGETIRMSARPAARRRRREW